MEHKLTGFSDQVLRIPHIYNVYIYTSNEDEKRNEKSNDHVFWRIRHIYDVYIYYTIYILYIMYIYIYFTPKCQMGSAKNQKTFLRHIITQLWYQNLIVY